MDKYSEQIVVNVGWYESEIKRLEAELKTANIKIEALNKLIQVHQTYNPKQSTK
jgi:hypothetical protein